MMKKLALGLIFTLLSTLLTGCHAANDAMGLDVVGYNHTDRDIGRFTVANGGGGYLGKHEGGGGFSCCASIPRLYKPGMTVTVRWGGVEVETQERVVEVPPYTPEDGGVLAVHFLRNGGIKVFVTMYVFLSHPNYPLKGDDARM
jgi:predicted small secreted protein